MKYIIAPTQQDVIGYKKVYYTPTGHNHCIVTLWIPKGTLVGAYDQKGRFDLHRKLRAEKAVVLQIEQLYPRDGQLKFVDQAHSRWDSTFIYQPLKEVVPRNRFSRKRKECESGIHFFLTRKEAEEY